MLIRRLRTAWSEGGWGAAMRGHKRHPWQGLADAPGIMEFASRLFSEDFEYDPGDLNRQDLVVAESEPIDESTVWGRPDPRLYAAWREILSQGGSADTVPRLADTAAQYRIPDEVVDRAYAEFSSSVDGFLYWVMSGDEHVVRAQQLLAEGPLDLTELAAVLFGSDMAPHDSEEVWFADQPGRKG